MELMQLENGKVTSLELLKQINFFRKQEDKNRTMIQHNDLLKVIRNEFEEEIGEGNISQSSYINSQNKSQPMFELTINEAKQVLVRESKVVRKAVIKKLDELENNLNPIKSRLEMLVECFGNNELVHLTAKVLDERDIAIKTKAEISNKKTATAMNTASKYSKRNKKIGTELEAITNDTYLFTPTQASKLLGLNVRELNNILVESDWVYINKNKEISGKYHPTKITENRGIFKRMNDKYGTLGITEAGLEIIENEIMIG